MSILKMCVAAFKRTTDLDNINRQTDCFVEFVRAFSEIFLVIYYGLLVYLQNEMAGKLHQKKNNKFASLSQLKGLETHSWLYLLYISVMLCFEYTFWLSSMQT
jgi:hypothetical protein